MFEIFRRGVACFSPASWAARFVIRILFLAALAGLVLSVALAYLMRPPATLPATTFSIASGESVAAIAAHAKDAGFVRSALLLQLVLATQYRPQDIFAGDYTFSAPTSTHAFAQMIASKQTVQHLVKVTIPEGLSASSTAMLIAAQLPDFSATTYGHVASSSEGYLFPDTYLVPGDITPTALVALQRRTFTEKLAPLQAAIASSSLNLPDVVTLASIIEREANDKTSMRTVAGIFLNRLAADMPLQADASIEYVLDKPLKDLTPDDLKVDSPYNTYLHRGLPPGPVGNPGLMAIKAVLNPIQSDYYYYLTAPDGTFHYAKTLAEHNQNITRYLQS